MYVSVCVWVFVCVVVRLVSLVGRALDAKLSQFSSHN